MAFSTNTPRQAFGGYVLGSISIPGKMGLLRAKVITGNTWNEGDVENSFRLIIPALRKAEK